MSRLTTNTLRAHWHGADRWISDGGARGAGRLVARITRTGVDFYFQYFAEDGRKRFLPLGPYDADGTRGLSLPAARDRAAELSALLRSGITDVHSHLERQRTEEDEKRKAAEDATKREREASQRSTLKQLLEAYVAHLENLGKQSAGDVRSIFTRHVYEAAPELTSRKAADISVDDLVSLIAKLVEAGKGRTAGKLRSYLRAAYALAISSRTDPSAPTAMRQFGITVNPVSNVGALSQYNRARNRVLSASELAAYLKHLETMPAGAMKDVLALGIHTGGQRPAQLLRARPEDVDLSGSTLTLHDPKGARKLPRQHVVPLVPDAKAILTRRLETLADNEPLFALDRKIPLKPEMLSATVKDISNAMVKAKESREPFQLRDIRRTVETVLAGLGVSSDIRAQLQSHGLGGVQIRHYDRHDYMPEKRKALKKWSHHVTQLRDGEHKHALAHAVQDSPELRVPTGP